MAFNRRRIAWILALAMLTALTLIFLCSTLLDSVVTHGPQLQADRSLEDQQSFLQRDQFIARGSGTHVPSAGVSLLANRGALRGTSQNLQNMQSAEKLPDPIDRAIWMAVSKNFPDTFPFNQSQKVQTALGVAFNGWFFVLQLLFGLVFWRQVVSQYPMLMPNFKPHKEAIKYHHMDPCVACCFQNPWRINCLGFFCPGAIGAMTFDALGLSYTIGLLALTFLPCCTMCVANTFTDLNERLGGRKMGYCSAWLCSCFCSFCLIAQNAQALDLITGAATGCCGVYEPPVEDGDVEDEKEI
mmetsp:Transcript_80392/g.142193  ORF Transcript_80392/g.142193 Transcript_80392/m.142193 type:complete len:299 (-) Transcript_80392:32-928(-)